MRMQTRYKEKHLQEADRMDLPEPTTESGVPGRFKSVIVGEKSLQPKSQDMVVVVESGRHMSAFRNYIYLQELPHSGARENNTY